MSVISWASAPVSRVFNIKDKLMHFKSADLDSRALEDR